MADYHFFVQNTSSSALYELVPTKASFKERVNEEKRAEFTFLFADLKKRADFYGISVLDMLGSERTEVWIERDGTKIFLGVVTTIYINPNFKTDLQVKIAVVDYYGLLAKRIVGVPSTVYSSTDAGAIAWDLIDDSQNSDSPYSDWGITQGSIATSVNRDRTYRFDKISETIRKLSNEELDTGFDFEISPAKEFNVYYPTKGQSRPNLVFDSANVADFSWEKPLMLELTNKVHVLGQGYNDDVVYATRNAANAYKTPFGLLESVMSERDVILTSTLQSKGDRLLLDEREAKIKFTLSHYDSIVGWNEYNLGDTVVVNFPDLGMSRASKRVMERRFAWEEDAVMISVKFDI